MDTDGVDLDNVDVLPRVHRRHPDINDVDVEAAWHSRIKAYRRPQSDPTQYAAVGFDMHGRLLEMCAVVNLDRGGVTIFHAMKAQPKLLHELGMM